MKILILENDPIFGRVLQQFLSKEGYDVVWLSSVNQAEESTFNAKFDLYIFDINLSTNREGIKLLHSLRFADDQTPAIFITDMCELQSMEDGFKLGALDYIKKPFEPMELLIRIKAKCKQEKIIYGDIEFFPSTETILQNKTTVDLGIVPCCIFLKLISNLGKVISKDELLECLEQPSFNALRVNLTKIKKRLKVNIINIRSKGYLLEKL